MIARTILVASVLFAEHAFCQDDTLLLNLPPREGLVMDWQSYDTFMSEPYGVIMVGATNAKDGAHFTGSVVASNLVQWGTVTAYTISFISAFPTGVVAQLLSSSTPFNGPDINYKKAENELFLTQYNGSGSWYSWFTVSNVSSFVVVSNRNRWTVSYNFSTTNFACWCNGERLPVFLKGRAGVQPPSLAIQGVRLGRTAEGIDKAGDIIGGLLVWTRELTDADVRSIK